MDAWLKAALNYTPRWLDYQMRRFEQPGCVIAVAHKGRLVLEQAFGYADAIKRKKLTPRHRFRAASHSKSFAAAAIMKLRQQDRLRLDDPLGRYLDGLHPDVAQATLNQVLSHSAGLIRDGLDAGQFQDRRPFPDERELRAALAEPPVLPGSSQLKYSNHGYGLIGLVIEAVTGQAYGDWVAREIIAPAKLVESQPDAPIPRGVPFARGHSSRLPLDRRVIVPGDNRTHALAPAAGLISTAGDLARFFASLDPAARHSVLSPASRREMIRRQWHDPHAIQPTYYGLGIMSGQVGEWDWFGHGGGFQGCLSRTFALPGQDLAVSILTNAVDGFSGTWGDGVIRVLQAFKTGGAARARTRDWTGRWWSLWGAVDLVPCADYVRIAVPGFFNPFIGTDKIEVTGRDQGIMRESSAFASPGEGARLVRGRNGKVREIWLGGAKLLPESRAAAELKRKYEG